MFILDDNLKFLFIYCKIKYSKSGIYTILIAKNQQREIIKAFEIFNKNNTDSRIVEILQYAKDISIQQSRLENIYLEVAFI